MKKSILFFISILVIISFLSILSCNKPGASPITVNPVNPMCRPTPTLCIPGNITYTRIYSGTNGSLTIPSNGSILITSQSQYIAAYSGYAAAGTPTPTPIPVDFSKQIIVGYNIISGGCNGASWSFTGVTGDCSKIILDTFTTPACNPSGIQCEYIMIENYCYLIDAAGLPLYSQNSAEQCGGTTITAQPAPFVPGAQTYIVATFAATPGPLTWAVNPTATPTP